MSTGSETVRASATTEDAGEEAPKVREHSILTLFMALALSAGALLGFERGLQEKRPVVHEWVSAFPADVWAFPAEERAPLADGGSFEFVSSQPGPVLTFEVDTARVDHIVADVTVERASDGKAVPYQLEWYWASEADVAAAEDWPFSPERGVTFYRPVRHRPNQHIADVWHHSRWTGTVAKAVITIRLWTNEPGPFRATFQRVGLEG